LIGENDRGPIVDAELVEPGPDNTDFLDSSNAKPAHSAGSRTYTLGDFER